MADSSDASAGLSLRHLGCLLVVVVSTILFWAPLSTLIKLSLHDERYTYIIVIPFISAFLFYFGRKRIFTGAQFCPVVGAPLLLLGFILSYIVSGRSFSVDLHDGLFLPVLAILVVWTGGFVLCYGSRSLKAATFPICFLLLILPLPQTFLDMIVLTLQQTSAQMTFVLFKLARVPVLQQGLRFSLPGVDIEIAEQCSGIRSSVSLFIASILVGHLFLLSGWRRACLSILTIPIVIFKNAVRIVTIAWLGVYVDPNIFHSKLHHEFGGLTFSILALAIMGAVLLLLQRSEVRPRKHNYALLALLFL